MARKYGNEFTPGHPMNVVARITDDGYEPGDPKSEEYMEHVLDQADEEN